MQGRPAACLGTLPSSQTVNLSTAGMRSAHGRATAIRDLESVPGSVGRIGKAVHMEISMSVWRRGFIDESPNGHRRRFVLFNQPNWQTNARFLGCFKHIVFVPKVVPNVSVRRHCPAIRRWDLGTLSLGTVTRGSCSQMQPSCSVRTQKLTRPLTSNRILCSFHAAGARGCVYHSRRPQRFDDHLPSDTRADMADAIQPVTESLWRYLVNQGCLSPSDHRRPRSKMKQ